MAVAQHRDLREYCLDVARRAQTASAHLTVAGSGQKESFLRRAAALLRTRSGEIASANAVDLSAARGQGLTDAQIDRLRLTPAGIESMAVALEEVAALPEPIG